MTTFYLIRHGESQGIYDTIAGRGPDVHLTETGQRQAQALAVHLRQEPIKLICSSPLDRARETAAPLARELALEPRVVEDLREIDFGDWTGRRFTDLEQEESWRQWNHFRSSTRIPHGESMVEVQARMVRVMAQLLHERPEESIALFSHGDPIRAALTYYLGMPLDLLPRLEIRPASMTILTISNWGVQVGALNLCLDKVTPLAQRPDAGGRAHRVPTARKKPASRPR